MQAEGYRQFFWKKKQFGIYLLGKVLSIVTFICEYTVALNLSELLPEELERSIENGRARKEKLDFEKRLLHAHEQLEQGQQLALQVQMEHERERQVLGRNGVACTKKTNPKNVSLL